MRRWENEIRRWGEDKRKEEKMRRWEEKTVRGGADEKMRTWDDEMMRSCEDEKMRRIHGPEALQPRRSLQKKPPKDVSKSSFLLKRAQKPPLKPLDPTLKWPPQDHLQTPQQEPVQKPPQEIPKKFASSWWWSSGAVSGLLSYNPVGNPMLNPTSC